MTKLKKNWTVLNLARKNFTSKKIQFFNMDNFDVASLRKKRKTLTFIFDGKNRDLKKSVMFRC